MTEIKKGKDAKKAIEEFAGNKKSKSKSFVNGCLACCKQFANDEGGKSKIMQFAGGAWLASLGAFGTLAAKELGADPKLMTDLGVNIISVGGGIILDSLVTSTVSKKTIIQSALTPKKTINKIGKNIKAMTDKLSNKSR